MPPPAAAAAPAAAVPPAAIAQAVAAAQQAAAAAAAAAAGGSEEERKAARLAKLQAWRAQQGQAGPAPVPPPAPAAAVPPPLPPQPPAQQAEGLLNEEGDDEEVDPLDAFMAAEVRQRFELKQCTASRPCLLAVVPALLACPLFSRRRSPAAGPAGPALSLHTSPPSPPWFTQVLPEVKAKEEEEKKRAEEERAKLAELLKVSRCCLWFLAGL